MILAIAAILAVPGAASADFVSGNFLYEWCTTDRADDLYWTSTARCQAYVIGVVDAMETHYRVHQISNPEIQKLACIPSSVTAGQLKDTVVKHLAKYPENRHEGAASATTLAIMIAYPCLER
nr:Rap1a/Tai family immunity protein [Brevundimonas diminuta]